MILQVVGCSHHQSSVAIREQLAFTAEQVQPFLDQFCEQFPDSEPVLLSTCNRTEFYCAADKQNSIPSLEEMVEFLAAQRGLLSADIDADLFSLFGRDAIRHLFSVTSSLDSMVIGETQIPAQVKLAYQLAIDASNHSSLETPRPIPLTHRIFQSAIRVARRINNETQIHRNRVSVPSVAIGVLAKQIFERLGNKQILILGAGEMAEETLNYVVSEGGNDITITNRTTEKAKDLADKFCGRVGKWSNLEQEIATADLIVSTTGATEPIVGKAMFDRVESVRKQKPLLILDLAIPRDFEESIGNQLNVYLYTLDDLQKECERNRQSRTTQYPKAMKIIEQETDQFVADVERRSNGATIVQLKQQADAAKEIELKRLMNRLDGLPPEQQAEIEQAFNRLVNKILHPPLKSLQSETSHDSTGLLEALKKLFQLSE